MVRKGFKNTEIGEIPEDWEVIELRRITEKIASGKSDTKNLESGVFFIYGSTGIIGKKNYFDYEGIKITVARVGANAGKVNLIDGKYCISDNTLFIETRNNLDTIFLKFYLDNINLNKFIFGSGQPLITGKILKDIQIPLPPLPEQKAIAEALSDTDAWIESLEKLIAKKRLIKQGAMQQLLTPPQRAVSGAEPWEVKKLGEVAEFFKGVGLSKSDITPNGDIECIHYGELFTEYKKEIKSVKNKTLNFNNAFFLRCNDVLMPTSDVTPRGLATASCINIKAIAS